MLLKHFHIPYHRCIYSATNITRRPSVLACLSTPAASSAAHYERHRWPEGFRDAVSLRQQSRGLGSPVALARAPMVLALVHTVPAPHNPSIVRSHLYPFGNVADLQTSALGVWQATCARSPLPRVSLGSSTVHAPPVFPAPHGRIAAVPVRPLRPHAIIPPC